LNGQIIDAATLDLTGEEALKRIISWRTGNFEILPSEPSHPQAIQKSAQSLLLELAQKMDEVQIQNAPQDNLHPTQSGKLAPILSAIPGVDFALLFEFKSIGELEIIDSWAVENPQALGAWAGQTCADLEALGIELQGGAFDRFVGFGTQCHTALICRESRRLCVGLNCSLSVEATHETVNKIGCQWDF
jgi:hypothetical protein